MLSLKDIRKKTLGREEESGEVLSDLKPLEIGFRVESKFDITKRNLSKRARLFVEELKVSGFYSNFWMWNFVFLNVAASFILFFTISRYYSTLPDLIGVNIDSDWSYDITISKRVLFVAPLVHLIVIVLTLLFSIKSHKKLIHLYIASFFQVTIMVIFEIIAVRNLIVYFL